MFSTGTHVLFASDQGTDKTALFCEATDRFTGAPAHPGRRWSPKSIATGTRRKRTKVKLNVGLLSQLVLRSFILIEGTTLREFQNRWSYE